MYLGSAIRNYLSMPWFHSASKRRQQLPSRRRGWNFVGIYLPDNRSCPLMYPCPHADLGSVILRRKRVAIAGSSVLLLLTIFLAILELGKFYMGNAIIYTMCIFGLNSFFSMCLFYYLFLTAIEFYPQTIRTLACGTIFCVYQLGRLLFSIHIQ